MSPWLLLGLLLAGAVSHAARAPLLHGCRARNSIMSKVSRTGIGPTRRWLILGWLAVVSGFHLPEDNGAVAQIDADVTPLSPHESTITGEVDGALDRRRLSHTPCTCTTQWCACTTRINSGYGLHFGSCTRRAVCAQLCPGFGRAPSCLALEPWPFHS